MILLSLPETGLIASCNRKNEIWLNISKSTGEMMIRTHQAKQGQGLTRGKHLFLKMGKKLNISEFIKLGLG